MRLRHMHFSYISSQTYNHIPLGRIASQRKGCFASFIFQAPHTLDPESIATSPSKSKTGLSGEKGEQLTKRTNYKDPKEASANK